MKLKKVLTLYKFNLENINKVIKDSLIKVNNVIINDPEYEINYGDQITYNNIKVIFYKELNLVMYKPAWYLCANKDNLHKLVFDILPAKYKHYHLSIAGRLDLDTEGLLIFTSSGKNNHLITNPINNIEKTYEVTTSSDITKEQLKVLNDEMLLLDGENAPYLSKVLSYELLGTNKISVTINTGRYHQVKRIFEAIKNPLIKLKRIKLGNLTLRDLAPGECYEFLIKDL